MTEWYASSQNLTIGYKSVTPVVYISYDQRPNDHIILYIKKTEEQFLSQRNTALDGHTKFKEVLA
jgi:hypothetical protein